MNNYLYLKQMCLFLSPVGEGSTTEDKEEGQGEDTKPEAECYNGGDGGQ